jgi:hypothetical protein
VALPIFRPIIEAIWARNVTPKAPLSGPSPDAQRRLVSLAIDYESGDRVRRSRGFVEHFRLGPDDQVHDTQYQICHSSYNERSGKQDEGKTRDVKLHEGYHRPRAQVDNGQQANGRGWTKARADYFQARNYFNYWQQPFRGRDTGHFSGEHYP